MTVNGKCNDCGHALTDEEIMVMLNIPTGENGVIFKGGWGGRVTSTPIHEEENKPQNSVKDKEVIINLLIDFERKSCQVLPDRYTQEYIAERLPPELFELRKLKWNGFKIVDITSKP